MGRILGEKERLMILENVAHKDEVIFKGELLTHTIIPVIKTMRLNTRRPPQLLCVLKN